MKIKILDLFCKAGGASYGMFWVDPLNIVITGYDIDQQPRYPFAFVKKDFRQSNPKLFDFVWASPPCQAYSRITKKQYRAAHPKLINETRSFLASFDIPYCIENVPCSPLNVNLKLSGQMFGLPVMKERWFETSFFLLSPSDARVKSRLHLKQSRAKDSNLYWMTNNEYYNAVPPEYSNFILKSYLSQKRKSFQ